MNEISRRNILLGGATTLALSSLARPARAQSAGNATGKNLVIVFAEGGWDPVYVLDPKPGLTTIDAPVGSIQQFGNVPIWADPSRPNTTAFFTRYADRCSVINGVQVRSIVHPDCWKRMLTGTPSDANPDLGAISAYELGRDLPVPYLILGTLAYSGPLAAVCGRAGTTNQILALLDPSYAYAPVPGGTVPGANQLAQVFPSLDEETLIHQYTRARAEREYATRGQRGYNKARVDDFISSLTRGEDLKAYASGFGTRGLAVNLDQQVNLALNGLQTGLCYAVNLGAGAWDTHYDDTLQSGLNETLYASLTTLTDALTARAGKAVGSKMIDETIVVVLSEMGRTPKLNAAGGKDHWPVTSALVFGAGIKGGQVLGGTTDALAAKNVDLTTGQLSESGVQLQPTNLMAGLLTAVGVDPTSYFPGVEAFRGFLA
jgi:uncharacterized protein (DUF1501 family)